MGIGSGLGKIAKTLGGAAKTTGKAVGTGAKVAYGAAKSAVSAWASNLHLSGSSGNYHENGNATRVGGSSATATGSSSENISVSLGTAHRSNTTVGPSLVNISKQIDELVQVAQGIANAIGVQEKAVARRVEATDLASDAIHPVNEAPIPEPVTGDMGADLEPVQAALDDFSKAIQSLTEQISKKGSGGAAGTTWWEKLTNFYNTTSSYYAVAKDIVKPAITGGSKILSKIPGLSKMGNAGLKLTGSIEQKVAQILETKAGNIIGKSVFGAGLAFGAWDLLRHASNGDWVGVGLDGTAMLASTAEASGVVSGGVGTAVAGTAAVAASVATVLRDAYEGIYGIPPDKDPEFHTRMNYIEDLGIKWAEQKLGMEQKKQAVKKAQDQQMTTPPPPVAKQVVTPTTPTPVVPTATPPAPPPPQAAKVTAPAASGRSSHKPKSKSHTPHGSSVQAAGSDYKPTDTASPSIGPVVDAAFQPPSLDTGANISTSSFEADVLKMAPGGSEEEIMNTILGRPSSSPPPRGARTRMGVGVSRSPYYNLDLDTSKKFYFDVTAIR